MRMILLKFNVQFGVIDQFGFWDSISLIIRLEQSKVFFRSRKLCSELSSSGSSLMPNVKPQTSEMTLR